MGQSSLGGETRASETSTKRREWRTRSRAGVEMLCCERETPRQFNKKKARTGARPGRRRSRGRRYQSKVERSRGHSRGRDIRNDCRGSLVTPGRRARARNEPRARPDGRRKGLWDRSRAGAQEACPCTCMEYSVVCPLAPSRGGVLQLRGNPVHGTNPRDGCAVVLYCLPSRAAKG